MGLFGKERSPEELCEEARKEQARRAVRAALKLYLKAADMGHAEAQYECGEIYSIGHKVPKDLTKALMWYEKAAEQGLARALRRCAEMYDKGHGTTRDPEKAKLYFQKAEEAESAGAE